MGFVDWLVLIGMLVIAVLLILVILVQRGRGGGLSAAFGGGGGSSAFGAKTGDVFTWITVVLASLFLLVNVLGNYVLRFEVEEREQPAQTAPAAEQDQAEGAAETDAAQETGQPAPAEGDAGEQTGQAPADEGAPDAQPKPLVNQPPAGQTGADTAQGDVEAEETP